MRATAGASPGADARYCAPRSRRAPFAVRGRAKYARRFSARAPRGDARQQQLSARAKKTERVDALKVQCGATNRFAWRVDSEPLSTPAGGSIGSSGTSLDALRPPTLDARRRSPRSRRVTLTTRVRSRGTGPAQSEPRHPRWRRKRRQLRRRRRPGATSTYPISDITNSAIQRAASAHTRANFPTASAALRP